MKGARKGDGSRQSHGSLSRPSVAIRTSGTGATATSPSFSRVAKVTRGLRRFVVASLDRAPARPAGVSEEPTFRKGRAHDRIVVAEVGRTASSSWTRAAPGDRGGVPKRNAAGGNPRGASDRPSDGRRSGSSVLAGSVTGRRRRVVWPRSRRRLSPQVRGSPPAGESRRASAMHKEGRRSAVKGASEDTARSTSREENARVEKWKPTCPKCVGRRETRHASVGPRKRALGEDSAPGSPNENVGARSRSVVGRSWSHASLVDDLLRSS